MVHHTTLDLKWIRKYYINTGVFKHRPIQHHEKFVLVISLSGHFKSYIFYMRFWMASAWNQWAVYAVCSGTVGAREVNPRPFHLRHPLKLLHQPDTWQEIHAHVLIQLMLAAAGRWCHIRHWNTKLHSKCSHFSRQRRSISLNVCLLYQSYYLIKVQVWIYQTSCLHVN